MFFVWLLFMVFGACCFGYIFGVDSFIKDYFKDFYSSIKHIFSDLNHKQKPYSVKKEETFEELDDFKEWDFQFLKTCNDNNAIKELDNINKQRLKVENNFKKRVQEDTKKVYTYNELIEQAEEELYKEI